MHQLGQAVTDPDEPLVVFMHLGCTDPTEYTKLVDPVSTLKGCLQLGRLLLVCFQYQ